MREVFTIEMDKKCDGTVSPPEAHVAVERKSPEKTGKNNTKYLTKLFPIRKLFTCTIYTRATEIIAFAIEKVERLQNAPAQSFPQCLTENEDNSVRSSFRKDFRV